MAAGLLSIGLTGLNAAQAGLTTTGHNIANVNTPGFSRQQVVQGTQTPMFTGGGFFGQGTTVDTVRRMYNQFLGAQTQQTTASATQLGTLSVQLQQVDAALGDTAAGLSPALDEFFRGVNGVAGAPGDVPSRQVMISDAHVLASRFQQLGSSLDDQQASANAQITAAVATVNAYTTQIASINRRIAELTAASTGTQQPNDLLDQRDQMVLNLNKLIGVSTVPQGDGMLNVYLSSGSALVVGMTASALTTLPDSGNPVNVQIGIKTQSGTAVRLASRDLSGGSIGGLFDFRDNALVQAQNSLGQIAVVLAQTFNDQHAKGIDLAGAAGGAFFTAPVPQVQPALTNDKLSTAILTATLVPGGTSALTASDYRVAYDGANYAVTRLSDNWNAFTGPALPTTVDGLVINVSGGPPTPGDSFLVQPTAHAVSQFGVAITDPRKIAAAMPPNLNPAGDNRNALALAALQSANLMGGTSTYGGAYGQLVAYVGATTGEAMVEAAAQDAMLVRAENAQQEVSGVNLDEEAANMLRYQQAYQASAKIMTIASTMFDTILAIGR